MCEFEYWIHVTVTHLEDFRERGTAEGAFFNVPDLDWYVIVNVSRQFERHVKVNSYR